jgi:hypothetical protein
MLAVLIPIAALALVALWCQRPAWLVDLGLFALIVAIPTEQQRITWLVVVAIVLIWRRVPWLAADLARKVRADRLPDHLLAVLIPAAARYETIDNQPPVTPPELPRVMSSSRSAAVRSFEDAKRARVMTRLQIRNRSFSGRNRRNPVIGATAVLQSVVPPAPVKKTEAETIADFLGQGLSVGQTVKRLPGYNGRNYQELKARVEAVALAIGSEAR